MNVHEDLTRVLMHIRTMASLKQEIAVAAEDMEVKRNDKQSLSELTSWSLVAHRLNIPKDIKCIIQNLLDPYLGQDSFPWGWTYDTFGIMLDITPWPAKECVDVDRSDDWYPKGWHPLAPPPPTKYSYGLPYCLDPENQYKRLKRHIQLPPFPLEN